MESLRCLNCGLMISTNRRHSPANADTVRQTITQWIAPRIMTASDHVCDSCWTLASNVNTQHRHLCVSCGRSLLRIRFHVLNMDSERAYDIYRLINEKMQRRLGRQARIGYDNICHPCWQRADRLRNRQLSVASTSTSQSTSMSINIDNSETESTPAVDETPAVNVIPAVDETAAVDEGQNIGQVQLPSYLRAPDTQQHCVFQGCINSQRRVIPTSIRKRVLCDHNYYIPANCRVCNEHMSAALWHNLSEAENAINSFKPNHLEEIIAWFQSSQTSVLDFQNIDGLNDDHLHYWIGLSRDQFNLILAEVPRINDMIRGQIALLAYLIKMRTGDSDERLSQLFNIPRRTLEVMMSKVRELLKQDFVPRHLGLSHISRQEVANRNLIIPNGLFGTADYSTAIAIFDGTYVHIQKSSNYKYQKQTYSLHKYRNLIKPFLLVCTDGYIIDVLGPYPATTSDADIMQNEFADGQPLKNYFASGDTFILDRGFRDAVSLLGQCHFNVSMPASLESGQHQLTTLQANKSRGTTICRWVVEIVNGRFKRDYKLFRQDFFNVASKHVMTDFTIAAAIINSFHPLLTDRANAQTILNIIQNKMYTDNPLATYVASHDLNRRRAQFERINVNNHNVNDFPRLDFEQLILISLGPYQIKQARSYYGEHIRSGGQYEIEIYRESNSNLRDLISQNDNKWLLRGRIQSRHVSRRVYFVYIVINNNLSGRDAIEQYCCNCLVGRRTVGCCAHVMSIIWYLSWARHEPNICPPAQFLDDLLIIYENE